MAIVSTKKKASNRKAAVISGAGLFIAVGLYFFSGPADGIMFGIMSSGAASIANLLSD